MTTNRSTALLLAAGALAVTAALPVAGQPTPTPTCIPGTAPPVPTGIPVVAPPYARPRGLRVTVTSVNPTTREVGFDVTLNTTAGFAQANRSYPFGTVTDTWQTLYGGTLATSYGGSWFQPYCDGAVIPVETFAGAGFVGPMVVDPAWPSMQDGMAGLWMAAYLGQATTWVTAYGGGLPFPAEVLDPQIPAVDFGDGNVAPGTPILPLVNTGPQYGTFRGSFTHTYPPAPNAFTIRAAAASLFLGPNSAGNPYVGDLTAGRPGVVVRDGDTFRVERLGWTGTGSQSWASHTFTYTVDSPQGRVLAITNTALVNFGAMEPIPASSAAGLFALALLLAGVGIILMRR